MRIPKECPKCGLLMTLAECVEDNPTECAVCYMKRMEEAPIGGGPDNDRCVACLGEPCGVSRMPAGLAFHVCEQCHGNGDFKTWFLDWFKKQFDEATK